MNDYADPRGDWKQWLTKLRSMGVDEDSVGALQSVGEEYTVEPHVDEVVRAAKAEAWEEGVRCAIQNSCEAQGHVLERNPYREGAQHD